MLITDLGDDVSKADHWGNETTAQGISDSIGDDDLIVRLTKETGVIVEYLEANKARCE